MQKLFNTEQTTVTNQPNTPSSGSDAMIHHLPDGSWTRSLFLEPRAQRASRPDKKVSVDRGSGHAAVAGLHSRAKTHAVAPSPHQGAKQPAQPQHRIPEPATKSSTYVVPKRSRVNLLDQLTRSIPVSVLLVMFGVTLVTTVALASPSVVLSIGRSDLIAPLLRGLFVTIAFGSAIAFILELCH